MPKDPMYVVKVHHVNDHSWDYKLNSLAEKGVYEFCAGKNLEELTEKIVEYLKHPDRAHYNIRFTLSPDFPEWHVNRQLGILEYYQLSEEEIRTLKRSLEEKLTGKVKKRHNPEITEEDKASLKSD
ncbi:hypothetical protein HY837_03985 [archaeon]|nr:hypothetical protein [archaeon]